MADATHLLGGTMLALSFLLLTQRRITALIDTCALQAIVLSLAAFGQGWIRDAPDCYAAGGIELAAGAIAIPIGLRTIVRRFEIERSLHSAVGVFPTLGFGAGLAGLAILAVVPTVLRQTAMTREDLALALSVVLLGCLFMLTQRHALAQAIGFLSLGNGVILAATGAGMPLLAELSAAFLVIASAMCGFIWFGIGERDGLDAPGGPDR